MLGAIFVVLVIFAFLRSWRSTLIICTSIPISIIGTFALLYFGGYTLNTMTFGGLALGVGMIVDASIVVLENTQRHLEMGKSRTLAAIEGSEEIWSAILASTLTHIAVFVPLFFLTGFSSVLFKQLSVVVVFSLAMSLFVAVTLVPVLCSLLMTEHHEEPTTGVIGWLFRTSGKLLDGIDARYAGILRVALKHRPTVLAVGTALFVLAIMLYPLLTFELMPQTDEGEVRVDIELPVGTRIEETQLAIVEMEERIRKAVPETVAIISQAGGGGFMGGASTHRGDITVQLTKKAERARSNETIASDLRRQLTGMPGVIARSRASGGSQLNRILGGNQDARLSLEIRGYDFDDAQRLVRESEALLRTVPGIADVRKAREDGRPELAVRVDRDKAAIFGLSVTAVADTLRTNVAGTQAAFFGSAARSTRLSSACGRRIASGFPMSATCS